MIKRYGANVFPCSTPATMSKQSVLNQNIKIYDYTPTFTKVSNFGIK